MKHPLSTLLNSSSLRETIRSLSTLIGREYFFYAVFPHTTQNDGACSRAHSRQIIACLRTNGEPHNTHSRPRYIRAAHSSQIYAPTSENGASHNTHCPDLCPSEQRSQSIASRLIAIGHHRVGIERKIFAYAANRMKRINRNFIAGIFNGVMIFIIKVDDVDKRNPANNER